MRTNIRSLLGHKKRPVIGTAEAKRITKLLDAPGVSVVATKQFLRKRSSVQTTNSHRYPLFFSSVARRAFSFLYWKNAPNDRESGF